MRDAVLIVCGGLFQVPAVEIAHELGLAAVVTDANPAAPAMALADEAVVLDIYDADGHARLAEELGERWNLRGVFAEGADVEVTVARAASRVGLPGIPLASALSTKNKALARARLDHAGIANPPWAEVASLAEARKAAERIGFPLVVKALDNSASRGTTKVTTPAGLAGAFAAAVANSTTATALLEGCMVGAEQSVELLFDGHGRCHRLNIVDRPFDTSGPWAIELGHVNPTRLGAAQRDELFALVERAAAACSVTFGAFKADTIWTQEGPRILEVTARLSGGFDCQYTTPLATGRNFIRAAMRLAVGLPLDPADLERRWDRYAAAWVAFPPPGIVTAVGGVDEVLAMPGVEHVFLRTSPGEEIRPYHDCGGRPAFVIAVGDTYDEAMARAQAGAAALRISTRSAAA